MVAQSIHNGSDDSVSLQITLTDCSLELNRMSLPSFVAKITLLEDRRTSSPDSVLGT